MYKRCVLRSLVLAVAMGVTLGFCILPCFAESITITTYYPSPVGVYNDLRAKKMAIGNTYYDPTLTLVSDDNLIVEGRVGIGVTVPSVALEINGGIKAIFPNAAGPKDLYYNAGTNVISYNDIAEIFEANEEVEPADVLCIGEDGKLRKSNKSYDTTVAGIVSTAPAILFEGSQLQVAPQPFMFQRGKKLPLALAGRVPCNVTTENGPVNCGDLLVTSSKLGYAMKASPDKLRPGMILGKALQPLEQGEAQIIVLIK